MYLGVAIYPCELQYVIVDGLCQIDEEACVGHSSLIQRHKNEVLKATRTLYDGTTKCVECH